MQTGVSSYYRNGDAASQSFASIFTQTVSNAMGLKNNGVMSDSTSNNGQLDSIGNSSEWGFPSTLIEGGFMSNTEDMKIIGADNEEGLQKYARGIAEGILQYYNIENTGLEGVSITGSSTTTTSGIDSKIYDLKYIEQEVEEVEYVDQNTFNKYVEENSRQALRVYTLDEETKKLIIANWSFTTEEGLKITASNPINFRSVLNKYTMPIEYMIDFLVHTDDAEMVGKLADLAIDTEYIIAVQDNVTTVETTVDIQHKNYRVIQMPDGSYRYPQDKFVDWHTVETTVSISETVSNEIELTYADSWFVRMSKDSSYASVAFNQSSGNNLTGDEGELIGEFNTTVYCAACNTPAGSLATASGVSATPNHTIAVHTDYYNGSAVGGKLAKGSQVLINGQVYTVEDTGDLSRVRQDNWIDIFCETPCENYADTLDSGNGTVKVYTVSNVREVTNNNENDSQDQDIEIENKNLKGINTTAGVLGEVKDTTTVMEESLGVDRVVGEMNNITDVTEKKKITTVRTISNKYDSGKEKIVSVEQKFIDVFLSSEGILNRFNMGWMEALLAQDEKTVNMIDLTKYLYNKAKDYDAGRESNEKYNFDVYKRNDLYNIYSSSGILEEFIKSLINNPLRLYMSNHKSIDEGEIEKYITTDVDEPSYKMLTNQYGGRGFGFDIFHRLNETDWNKGTQTDKRIVDHYEDLSFNIIPFVNLDDTLETETVDQVMRMEIEKWHDVVEQSIQNKGIQLEDYQIDALTVIAYEYGWSEKDTESFKSAYQTYYQADNKEGFKENFKIAQGTVKPFYIMSDVVDKTEEEEKQQIRASLTWNLFDKGQYKTPEGEILDPDSFHGKGEILGVAYEIWKEVCDRFTTYGPTGNIPVVNGTQIDCSGYVSWVLYEYGKATGNDALVQEFQGWQHTTETLKAVDWNKLGFEVIPVAAGQNVTDILQPGDILDRSVGDGARGHTQIIVEVKDGKVYTYDCGSASHWIGKNGEAYISNFAADSRPGIIIRKR